MWFRHRDKDIRQYAEPGTAAYERFTRSPRWLAEGAEDTPADMPPATSTEPGAGQADMTPVPTPAGVDHPQDKAKRRPTKREADGVRDES